MNLCVRSSLRRDRCRAQELIGEEGTGWNARRSRYSVDGREYLTAVEEGQAPIETARRGIRTSVANTTPQGTG
jgi:hypothetical protein